MRQATARVIAALAASLLLSSSVLAAPGLRLSWDHCSADGVVSNKLFACNTNTGSEVLVLSFESPVASTDRQSIEMTLHITAWDGALPDWWRAFGPGSCRPTALTYSLLDPLAAACVNPWEGHNAAAAIADLVPLASNPSLWRLRVVAAVPDQFQVSTGVETFAIALILRHVATVASGACAGCLKPVCIGFGAAKLVGPVGTTSFGIAAGGPNPGGGPSTVTWQGAYVAGYTGTAGYSEMICAPSGPDPVHASTWGAVKALYR
jgi:hypothetical protein